MFYSRGNRKLMQVMLAWYCNYTLWFSCVNILVIMCLVSPQHKLGNSMGGDALHSVGEASPNIMWTRVCLPYPSHDSLITCR